MIIIPNSIIIFLCMLMILNRVSSKEPNEPFIFGNKTVLRILNGWRGHLGDVPYQVLFKMKKFYEYNTFCGGSIVAANKVISAAHCFADDPNFCDKLLHLKPSLRAPLRWMYAVAGTVHSPGRPTKDSVQNGQWRRLKHIHYPKSYNFPHSDICIVVTKTPFVFNEYVNYIPYASQDMDYSGTCLTSGFGSTKRNSDIPSKQLMLAHASLVPMSECNKQYGSGRKFICTAPPSGPLKGDSGGPLVCYRTTDPKENSSTGILVGVTCGGFTKPPYYFIYTRVSFHRSLIDDYVNTSSRSKGLVCYVLIHVTLLF